MSEQAEVSEEAIAIVGMSGRFPGAENVDTLWRNVRDGVESFVALDDRDLEAAGVDPALASRPGYVRAAYPLADVDKFDAAFFGLSPRAAEILDPQHRLFLECAWEALEHAGYDAESWPKAVALFAGTGAPAYLYSQLIPQRELLGSVGTYQVGISNEKDFLPTRVAHKLGLRGPCIAVQTACSSSLVAVHLACQSLLSGESSVALAGGVSLSLPQRAGYLAQEGDILSPDGHCRAFDARAQGTVRGSGAGIVVLKRLTDALAQGDTIHAVIRGSAVNNDGAGRAGYTAPGAEGQAAVISEALGVAGVKPGDIQYVEAHGTATPLGDPIEVSALNQAFRSRANAPGTIALGSLKTNIGHLDTAAGVAGLIKVVMALRHQQLPPSLHFERPNPVIDFAAGPFFVNNTLRPWAPPHGAPRRAGVSSFGIGGTNAHVILEEAPSIETASSSRSAHLLLLSARSEAALDVATEQLASHLTRNPELELADVAHTLMVGRRRFEHRRAIVCRDGEDARQVLTSRDESRLLTLHEAAVERQTAFLFPGQGAQFAGMARGIHEQLPVFRKHLDACCDLLLPTLKLDLRPLLLARDADIEADRQLRRTALTQPALFAVSYALARTWMAWGVKPRAMLGHSVGEYVAACLAGVLKLEDALSLIAARGALIEQLPPGAMLSVSLPEAQVQELLGKELSLAAVNAPSLCVVSGPMESVDRLATRLEQSRVACRRLHTSHAFHSSMMAPILGAFAERLRAVRWSEPTLPWVSNVTGTWITPEQARSPDYWVEHLRRPVRFAQGIRTLMEEPSRALLEVGPGNTLATLARRASPAPSVVVASMRHAQETRTDLEALLGAAGRLWLSGVRLDGTKLYGPEARRRVPLPTYPFERQRYWVEARPAKDTHDTRGRVTKRPETAGWFYSLAWKQARRAEPSRANGGWLLFVDGPGTAVAERLRRSGCSVVEVVPGSDFLPLAADRFAMDGTRPEHHAWLLEALGDARPERVAFLDGWALAGHAPGSTAHVEAAIARSFYPPLYLARAMEARWPGGVTSLTVVTAGAHDVTGEEPLDPAQALALGPCRVLPQELGPGWRCRAVDVTVPPKEGSASARMWLDTLVAELESDPRDAVVALRGRHRWVEDFAPVSLPDVSTRGLLREGGVYLITGGLGRMGLALASRLATEVRARLVLVGRTGLPPREAWTAWQAEHGHEDATSRKLRVLEDLERQGAEVLVVSADVTSDEDCQRMVALARERFGALHGVIHAAGVVGAPANVLVSEVVPSRCGLLFEAKVHGLLALTRALKAEPLDFVMLQSSLSTVLGGLGFAAYASANHFLDAFAAEQARHGETPWLSVDWDGWTEEAGRLGLTLEEGARAFQRILGLGEGGRLLVSTGELSARRARGTVPSEAAAAVAGAPGSRPASAHARPALGTPYVAPEDAIQQQIAELWQELLGVDRVGIHDNFFELGGHSLLGMQVVSRLRELFSVEVSIRGLFETPTVLGVVNAILEAQASQVDAGRLEALLAEMEKAP
ncbi:malonyl CoA-acyl carrier protein transacylase [Corallococcus coralloides DSM 2259]|uniref:Phenolphthiocerol/phthiocerol polyketide synthase subunit E n=1 Tax=Corallococcus coralloides (strain ATCC 25202 / DSM 2259 / NBRC 100086 / M2) TaxID=1144275 RepID=H8N207_CORCM|nr:type I polyketide synthase [Corallococcus coralloides]AFE09968.1 malonyl CoA-acyl carrier protein transacylase [Corallococcus coralloides DSM 2259]